MREQLEGVLSEAVVGRLASPRSFERGEEYLEEGRVGPLRTETGRLSATVEGNESYTVELHAKEGRLRFSCSCPVGLDGAFCKHCVAVALRWLREDEPLGPTLEDARAHLEGLPPSALAELLIDHAHGDERLARRLLLLTARSAQPANGDIDSLRMLIDQAFAFGEFIPYREVWGYVSGIEETLDVLDELLAEGRASEVIELTEYALAAVERSLEHIDDSDGQMSDLATRLQDLHFEACDEGKPDPVQLAQRLFSRELDGHWDLFHRAAATYEEILGETGLAHYRELANARWEHVGKLDPSDGSRERYGSRFRITQIMETLAELSGDLSEQIEVRQRDLASPYNFLRIAELCSSRGEHDLALQWAQRGISEFPDSPDQRLHSFLIAEHRRRGQTAEAIEHSSAMFASRPALDTYKQLAIDAKTLGEWRQRRKDALALLRGGKLGQDRRRSFLPPHDASELVRVLLWERDLEAAWQAANESGCTTSLWLELADGRRAEHPEDTLAVYRSHVERTIAGRDKHSYEEAVRLIDEAIRPLLVECGRPHDFASYLEEVRVAHKPKRNLMKLMDGLQASKAA